MKTQTIHTNEMTLQPFFGRLANQTTHNLTGVVSDPTVATTPDHKEVTMTTQVSKHNDRFAISSAKAISTSRGVSMRHFNTMLAIALFTLLFASICAAQQASTMAVPNLIRYSGTLKDAQGVASAPSPTVGVTFAIYKQQDGGAAVWQETQNVAPAAGGQYSVILGSTTAAGLPDDLFSQQEERWLGVQVQGQAEEARVLLVSVPYAFKAHEAETLGGLPASAFVKASDANNGTSVNALATNGITAAGAPSAGIASQQLFTCTGCTTGNIPLLTDTTGDLENSLMSQAVSGATVVNDSGNFNLGSYANNYRIGGTPVLGVSPYPSYNLSIGLNAGSATSTAGNGNVFVGNYAGGSNTSSQINTYVGYGAGANNNTGGYNVMVGYGAGYSNKVSGNTMIGTYSGFNTTGGYNTFLGDGAGGNNTTGNSNIYLGANAEGPGSPQENNTIRIGAQGAGSGQQTAAYFAGIVSNPTSYASPVPVVTIASNGRLGVQNITSGGGGGIGPCNAYPALSGSYFALWTSKTTIGCPDTYLTLNGTTLNMVGNVTAALTVTGADINATGDFKANGTPGISGIADTTTGTCTLTFQEGILTAMNGC